MSQFDGLLDIKTDKKTTPKSKPKILERKIATPPPVETTGSAKQLAKSRDTDYTQTSVYIKKETQTMVKRALLVDTQNRDFSELVEDLILAWAVKNQNH
jgi:hypothetical protein